MGNIYNKILNVQKAVRALKKDGKGYNYGYVTGDKLLSVVRPIMDEQGLLLMPEVEGVSSEAVTYDTVSNGKVYTKTEILYHVHMLMTWVDAESGETLTQKWSASGMNNFDKGFGSALTYGERYYLLKVFHLQTDNDDVDAVSSDREKELEQASMELMKSGQQVIIQPTGQRKPFSPDEYAKAVKFAAAGVKNGKGETMREVFLRTNPTQEQLAQFDFDVLKETDYRKMKEEEMSTNQN